MRRAVWLVTAAVILVVGGAVGWYLFAPKPSEERRDAAPEGVLVSSGTLQDGEPLHQASGTVKLLRQGEGYVLRFEAYNATPGPDVFYYVTPKLRASTIDDVERAGLKVTTEGMMGHATLRGDFNVPLPEGFDPEIHRGLSVWCDTYNTLFGYADLQETLAPPP